MLRDSKRRASTHFHRALNLYGDENWEHEVTADSIDTLTEGPCKIQHKDGREDYVTISEMVEKYSMDRQQVLRLFREFTKRSKGWKLIKE